MMNVAVVGQGFVGLTLSVFLGLKKLQEKLDFFFLKNFKMADSKKLIF